MPVASSIMSSVLMAPGVTLISCLSLVSLQRGIEWVQSIAHTPQKGLKRQIKPYIKQIDQVLERVLNGVKFEFTTTDVLLMAIVVLLIAVLLEFGEARSTPTQVVGVKDMPLTVTVKEPKSKKSE